MPILSAGYVARVTGVSLGRLYEDPKNYVKAQLLVAEMHRYEPLPIYGYDSFGGWEFGGEISIPYESGFALAVVKAASEKVEDVEKLEVPDPKNAGSLPLTMEAAREATRLGYPAAFPAGGVFTWACNVVGLLRMMRWLIEKPDLVHKLLRKCTDFSVAIAESFVGEFGAESCLPVDLAAFEANTLISPKHFEEFALPYIKEVHEKILNMGVPRFLTHLCGEHNKNLQHWQKIPFGKPGILSFASEVDLLTAKKFFGQDNVIMGNVKTALIACRSFEEVFETSRQCVEKGKDNPAGYILSPECEIPPMSPPVNIYAMVKAANDYGAY